MEAQAALLDPGPVQALAQRAVEAAHAAGATYADARFTRSVMHRYCFGTSIGDQDFAMDFEFVGCGVRALVDGAWGFASAALWQSEPNIGERVVQLARDAVAQGKTAATVTTVRGTQPPLELSPTPVVTGTWATPCTIDPFRVTIEEKRDAMMMWTQYADQQGFFIENPTSELDFARQERVVATSDGSLFTQTCYETGGLILLWTKDWRRKTVIHGIERAGQGWERLLDANIPAQIDAVRTGSDDRRAPLPIGRYTLVCDGSTMGSIIGESVGLATQLDRALGYEANSGGTSFLTDPLAMLGTFQVAAPLVTVMANRSAPAHLATVQWDDEGVVPRETTLIKNGVLADFQTTREQARWLAPYYTRAGKPMTSNGYAGAQDALHLTMQMRPNFALAPSATSASLEDLTTSVKHGLLLERCTLTDVDFQARNGILAPSANSGRMRLIVDGRIGRPVDAKSAVVQVNTLQLLQQIKGVGDASTTDIFPQSQYDWLRSMQGPFTSDKGNPPQRTSYTAQGVAALIDNQAVIDLTRKA
jgi:TldD protein